MKFEDRVFTLNKRQVNKLYKNHNIRRVAPGNTVKIVIPEDVNELVVVISEPGNHLGYISFKDAWNL